MIFLHYYFRCSSFSYSLKYQRHKPLQYLYLLTTYNLALFIFS